MDCLQKVHQACDLVTLVGRHQFGALNCKQIKTYNSTNSTVMGQNGLAFNSLWNKAPLRHLLLTSIMRRRKAFSNLHTNCFNTTGY